MEKPTAELILKYVATSPPREYGGYSQQDVATAKAALRLIARERRKIERLAAARREDLGLRDRNGLPA